MLLSEHFTLFELTQSSTAVRLGISNTPNLDEVKNLTELCKHLLEPLRKAMNKPIIINSGFRCRALNNAVAGAATSNHLFGYAADIRLASAADGVKMQKWIVANVDYDECFFETNGNSNWLHVAYRNGKVNRKKNGFIELN